MKPKDWLLDGWDWFKEIGWVIILLVMITIGIAFGMCMSVNVEHADKEKFMDACMQDHKEYECEAMWRSGKSETIPVYVPMNMGRMGK